MFCGNAADKFIPRMVVYKSGNCYETGQQEALATQCIIVWHMGGLTRTFLKHGFSNNLF